MQTNTPAVPPPNDIPRHAIELRFIELTRRHVRRLHDAQRLFQDNRRDAAITELVTLEVEITDLIQQLREGGAA